ncbi:MAG: outer membrane lipoprotein carrier protein LolA [Dysgonamonadaceae bacterium]|jgi:outer membrane lipoprotein-sorting protein|nr:outer membrane lipoprotein carrier protein LolA [Dysgonamonadaceae bacterium]
MKKIFIILIVLLISNKIYAQGDFTPIVSAGKFKEELKTESAGITGIESNFSQTKYIGLLSEKIVSSGKFYYKKPDKICMDYSLPVKYLMVINGNKIRISSDGKSNVYDLSANKMMSQIQTLVSACMTGNPEKLSSGYDLAFKENEKLYWVRALPQGSVKSYLKSIDIYLDKNDFSVYQLKITEVSDDYTEYTFTAKKKNPAIPDAKFSIK